jgi:hypothetical protein
MKLFTRQFTKDFIVSVLFIIVFYLLTHNPITHPVPKPTQGKWSIELLQHPLLFGIAGHNYLALRNASTTITEEIHGLATDTTTGKWKYVGKDKQDVLRVWEFDGQRYQAKESSFPGIILSQGDETDIQTTWEKANDCIEKINEASIPYPAFGFKIRGETENSNSVAYTLAHCMGLTIQHLGLFTPGGRQNLLEN